MAEGRKRGHHRNERSIYFELFGVILIATGLFTLASLWGWDSGLLGGWARAFFTYCFGIGAWVAALTLVVTGGAYLYRQGSLDLGTKEFAAATYFVLALVAWHWWQVEPGGELRPDDLARYGGAVGGAGALCLRHILGETGTPLFLLAAAVITTVVLTRWSIRDGVLLVGSKAKTGVTEATHSVVTVREKLQVQLRL